MAAASRALLARPMRETPARERSKLHSTYLRRAELARLNTWDFPNLHPRFRVRDGTFAPMNFPMKNPDQLPDRGFG